MSRGCPPRFKQILRNFFETVRIPPSVIKNENRLTSGFPASSLTHDNRDAVFLYTIKYLLACETGLESIIQFYEYVAILTMLEYGKSFTLRLNAQRRRAWCRRYEISFRLGRAIE